ncbi:hypothetical protein G7059_08890 [Erysipelothrix sp. HDW6A]|uniref:hypothetical protein n=1 Tax=Erysipelothrix sp. HDW6A TaxID=2714928 RepID=UPI00140917D1|nr:hypothetical protein [Erysipelothrix sp. HDW6A]QIK57950.1 hypothetical protein G7059_08890 [Erysipelothrix sp. HDW6A]
MGKDDRLRKMLLDFDIPSIDCNAVVEMISNIGPYDNPKASAVYKTLKEIKRKSSYR